MDDSVFVHEADCLAQLDEVELTSPFRVLRIHHPVEQLASCPGKKQTTILIEPRNSFFFKKTRFFFNLLK